MIVLQLKEISNGDIHRFRWSSLPAPVSVGTSRKADIALERSRHVDLAGIEFNVRVETDRAIVRRASKLTRLVIDGEPLLFEDMELAHGAHELMMEDHRFILSIGIQEEADND